MSISICHYRTVHIGAMLSFFEDEDALAVAQAIDSGGMQDRLWRNTTREAKLAGEKLGGCGYAWTGGLPAVMPNMHMVMVAIATKCPQGKDSKSF